MAFNKKFKSDEPYKEPKIILEVQRTQGEEFGMLIAVVEYEFKGKFYRRLEKINLSKHKQFGWQMRKRKGLSGEDFKVVIEQSIEIREALDGANVPDGSAF
jgi:hypothetical protein